MSTPRPSHPRTSKHEKHPNMRLTPPRPTLPVSLLHTHAFGPLLSPASHARVHKGSYFALPAQGAQRATLESRDSESSVQTVVPRLEEGEGNTPDLTSSSSSSSGSIGPTSTSGMLLTPGYSTSPTIGETPSPLQSTPTPSRRTHTTSLLLSTPYRPSSPTLSLILPAPENKRTITFPLPYTPTHEPVATVARFGRISQDFECVWGPVPGESWERIWAAERAEEEERERRRERRERRRANRAAYGEREERVGLSLERVEGVRAWEKDVDHEMARGSQAGEKVLMDTGPGPPEG
ncbi:hypothetical protein CALVIDRAFT_383143 [Calocera viscosa TUFC12733]|uniref:Uncharacterized protein n=1 Tax=Calocera viscosa (strain TUFC12733) TaxID=1330018 RepID=A0A167Q7D2_CALVF|nr:hypothetical protein CALVIDRAFT_383143 [Calocera viscosa TUFC12733]